GVLIDLAASANTVGGTAAGAANLVSGNTLEGVRITGAGTSRNLVLGNRIGTDAFGTAPLGNGEDGVLIDFAASANTVGGTAAGAGNLISANGTIASGFGRGVRISGAGTTANLILGNLIGTDPSSSLFLGNVSDGVLIDDGATANTVGGTTRGA